MAEELKRLFFGTAVHAPWPTLPNEERILEPEHRHLTLAFLGEVPLSPLLSRLSTFSLANSPLLIPPIGSVGYFDRCDFLPPAHPHVAAWHVQWLNSHAPIISLQATLSDWLLTAGYPIDRRPWHPHVTLCRQPFSSPLWQKTFHPTPCYTTFLHLYESLGNLQYVSRWHYPLLSPIEEIDHTADMAFRLRGHTLHSLYDAAFTALAFKVECLPFFPTHPPELHSLDDIVIHLNRVITRMDERVGCPLKGVSFHGNLQTLNHSILEWEMIVDV